MNKNIGPGNFSYLQIVLVCGAIALFYFSFLPVNYSFDGTVFSHFLRYALVEHNWLGVTQIHHLLYFPANYLVYRVLELIFNYRVLEFFQLQLFSMFFGIMTLVVVERMLKKICLTLAIRLIGIAAVAFSYAFWLYALDAEVHMAGIFFVAAGLYLLIFRESKPYSLVWAALCFALAAGFHLTNVLIAGTVLIYFLYQRAPWRRYAQFFLAYLSFMLLLYSVYAAIAHKPVYRILYNVFFGSNIYSGYKSTSFKALALPTVVSSLASLKHALVTNMGVCSWLILAGFLALLAIACKQKIPATKKVFRLTMLFWFIPFFLFFTFWDTANIEFKIHALIPLLLIAISALDKLKPLVAHALGVSLVSALLLINLFYGIRPLADIGKNTNYQVALAIQKATPLRAQILITGNFLGYGYGKIYIPYFALREVIILDWLLGKGHSFPEIYAQLKKNTASGRPVYALGEIVEMGEPLKNLLNFHHIKGSVYSQFNSGIRFILTAKLPGGYRLYRLEFASP
jgi:4-amino-4-deoxy-L-arabinose transferase-like glycosyltransferase